MRIGMMADVYKPRISGITNYIALNKQYLERAGHEVFVFTFGDELYHDEETNIVRSPGMPLLDTGYFLSFRYSPAAVHLLSTMDVVHVHHPFLSGSLALRSCRPRGIPVIFTNHTRYDIYAQTYLPGISDMLGIAAIQSYLPTFCRSCDLVIAPSEGLKQVLIKMGVDANLEVIPNGVDLTPFRAVQPLTRQEIGLDKDEVVLIYTGRLAPEKGLDFLIKSFAGLAQAYAGVHLLLVGDGPERDRLTELVALRGLKTRVTFTGMVPYDQMPRYLALADIFVSASVSEVHPLSVIEAMAAGLPVLGIDSPGVSDTVIDEVTGVIARQKDLAEFTAKLIRLTTQTDYRHKLGAAARQEVQKYAIERTTELMLARYHTVEAAAVDRQRSLRARWARFVDRMRR
jgi:glycosyltransferase involved in cell wall biosynthesis